MKLLAVSDLHVGHAENRRALETVTPRPEDWLILGGDVGETPDHLRLVLDTLGPRFARLVWVPGNHELYSRPQDPAELRGLERYQALVALCRERGVLTPEDPYPTWRGEGGPHLLVPMFLGYDYSFRPDDVPYERVLAWAAEEGIYATDEVLYDPHPYPSRAALCHARVALTEARLNAAPALPKVLINHYPLRQDLVFIPRVPRYSPWCGTRLTTDWHRRFGAAVVVNGHLHVRTTVRMDGVRFEEVSFGYPRERRTGRTLEESIKQILPDPGHPATVVV